MSFWSEKQRAPIALSILVAVVVGLLTALGFDRLSRGEGAGPGLIGAAAGLAVAWVCALVLHGRGRGAEERRMLLQATRQLAER